jgi:hypothetical protein
MAGPVPGHRRLEPRAVRTRAAGSMELPSEDRKRGLTELTKLKRRRFKKMRAQPIGISAAPN